MRDRTESEKIGQAVSKLIAEKGLLDKVLLASFDSFKILAAKKENPSLTVGIFYKKGMWDQRDADHMKREYYFDFCLGDELDWSSTRSCMFVMLTSFTTHIHEATTKKETDISN